MDWANEIYNRLIIESTINLFNDNFTKESSCKSITTNDIDKLLGYASILSVSDVDGEISKAYEIISRLIELYGNSYERIIPFADVVLSRIGNFPGRSLMRDRLYSGSEPELNINLSLERIAREAENTLQNDISLTDFQYNLFSSLKKHNILSFSAPTSAGKSFILALSLVDRVKDFPSECIVYIVPTRALISEVSTTIRHTFYKSGMKDVIIRTTPVLVEKATISSGAIYVLTQERLISLLSNSYNNSGFYIDLLIVDEAHEIQKGKRGIVLQNSIEMVLRLFPNVSMLFSSPLIKNPEYFLSLFKRDMTGHSFVENISPVSQNIILVSTVNRKISTAKISILHDGKVIDIGNVDLGFKLRGSKGEQRAAFSKYICKQDESLIIFSNKPSDAENVAIELANINKHEISDELCEFIDFIHDEIHSYYSLIHCLQSGVAYHYGDMPSIIRSGIERLFKSGDIKFIVCTSTLLQGVNLPAKHIVVEDPHSGDEPMMRADFLNLSGRAGRLLKEFHGNIWCIKPDSWEDDSYQGEKLQEISSSMSNVMHDGGGIILNLIEDIELNDKEKDLAEVAFAKLYHEIKDDEKFNTYLTSEYENSDSHEIFEYNYDYIRRLKITVPNDILLLHRTIRPEYLQSLYDFFLNENDLISYSLYSPYYKGGKSRIDQAIAIIRDVFSWDISDRYSRWISMLSYKWMTGKSMSSIIKYEVDREIIINYSDDGFIEEIAKKRKVTKIIRKLLNSLEKQVRYNLVKYMEVYQDILKLVMRERGMESEALKVESISAYLEFGSCNVDVLNLMSLGLSRSTALMIYKKKKPGGLKTPEEYMDFLKNIDLDKINIPSFCRREIGDIVGI
ncbi:DEAD/DEAH box helicase [Yersinia sp. HM-2024]|uniref:DEAD/DEAH box helicase n=1 Tax=Yersinia sp. HM-2024 TaxID=3344550 RepID=UPI00370DDFFD